MMYVEKAPDKWHLSPTRLPTATELATIAALLAIGRSNPVTAGEMAKKAAGLWDACELERARLESDPILDAMERESKDEMFAEWSFANLVRFFLDASAVDVRGGQLCVYVKHFDNRSAAESAPTVPLDKFLAGLMPKKREADRPAIYQRYWTALGLDGAEQIARDKERGVPAWRTRGFDEAFQEWQQAEITAKRREAGRKGGQSRQGGKGAATRPGPAEPAPPPKKRR